MSFFDRLLGRNTPNIEVSVKKKKEVEYPLQGQIVPHPGHKIFEVDIETGKATEASFRVKEGGTVTIMIAGQSEAVGRHTENRKLITKQGYIYIAALKKETAEKKFKNNPNQEAYYKKAGHMNLGELNLNTI